MGKPGGLDEVGIDVEDEPFLFAARAVASGGEAGDFEEGREGGKVGTAAAFGKALKERVMEGGPVFGPFGGEEGLLGFVEGEEGDCFALGDGEGDFAEESGVSGGVAPAEIELGVGGFAAGFFDESRGRAKGGDGGGEFVVEVAGETLEGALEAVLEAGAFGAGEFADPDVLQAGEDEAEQGEEADGGPGAESAGFEILQIHVYLGATYTLPGGAARYCNFPVKGTLRTLRRNMTQSQTP